jgi:two-component system, OmpR family, KDP operon response regulator KdpE
MRELHARVQVALRHHRGENGGEEHPAELDVGPLHLDLVHRQAVYDGRPLDLTARELDFLAYLARNAGKGCTRRMILENVWGPGYAVSCRSPSLPARRSDHPDSPERGALPG